MNIKYRVFGGEKKNQKKEREKWEIVSGTFVGVAVLI